ELLPNFNRRQLWRALMLDANPVANATGLDWMLTAPQEALLRATLGRLDTLPPLQHQRVTYRRHTDVFRALDVGDTDIAVQDELIRLCAAFLDQGQALAPMPGREHGFLQAVAALYAAGAGAPRGCPGVDADFRAIAQAGTPAL